MPCELELQAYLAAQSRLDSLLSQYDDLVWQISAATGEVFGAQQALEICMGNLNPLQSQARGSEEKHLFEAMHNAATALRGKLLAGNK